MFATLFLLALVLVQSVLAQSGLSIGTPTLAQCQKAQINWTDTGKSPYEFAVVYADDPCGPAIDEFDNLNSTAITWTVAIRSGTNVTLFVEDAVGDQAWSGTITIGNSSDTSCLAGSSAGSGTATSSPAPSSSAFAPVGAANAGVGPSASAAFLAHVNTVTLVGSSALALIVFAL